MSEDAAWTTPLDAGYLKCLPKIGLKVLDHIRFSPDTTDFTPIFNKIEGEKPDVIITGISPCRRAADGAVEEPAGADPDVRRRLAGDQLDASGRTPTAPPTACSIRRVSGPDVAVTPKTLPFVDGLQEEVRQLPVLLRLHRL